jgi:hypothetical protein
MFDKLKKIFAPPEPTYTAPAPPPRTTEEQAVWDKVLSYPLASWNVVHTPINYRNSSSSKTYLQTTNPSGSEVKVILNKNYYNTYDINDVENRTPNFTYEVEIDGQSLRELSSDFVHSLYDTLKDRVESDFGYKKRLEDEASAAQAAKTKERKDLFGKL